MLHKDNQCHPSLITRTVRRTKARAALRSHFLPLYVSDLSGVPCSVPTRRAGGPCQQEEAPRKLQTVRRLLENLTHLWMFILFYFFSSYVFIYFLSVWVPTSVPCCHIGNCSDVSLCWCVS